MGMGYYGSEDLGKKRGCRHNAAPCVLPWQQRCADYAHLSTIVPGTPMAASWGQPLVCPRLIDRSIELAAIDRALAHVRNDQGLVLMIAGEAGIGKSRLLAEARAHAQRLGFLCLEGRCFEPDIALPFAPLLDLLQTHLGGMPVAELPSALSDAAPDLSRLLPDRMMHGPARAPSAPLEPAQEKRRLFHALSRFILRQATAQPLLVVIEDLHWSDDTSLEYLLYLTRHAAAHPLLVLLSYRSDEGAPGLRHFRTELDRGRLARELDLKPLTRRGVEAMVRAIAALDRPVQLFLDTLYALTDGNPFFIEEILTALVVAPEHPPPCTSGIASRLMRCASRDRCMMPSGVGSSRSARRPSGCSHWQRWPAGGSMFPCSRSLPGRATLYCCGRLRTDGGAVGEREMAERFAFRHALTRQAIYTQLLARERQSLLLDVRGGA